MPALQAPALKARFTSGGISFNYWRGIDFGERYVGIENPR
jgi:hypothetical protein